MAIELSSLTLCKALLAKHYPDMKPSEVFESRLRGSVVELWSHNRENLGSNSGHGALLRCGYKLLALILAQNVNKPHHEVKH